jgi:recombination protein RecA
MARDVKKTFEDVIDKLIGLVDKEHGRGALMCSGKGELPGVETVSTGSVTLDRALGVGGYPKGRVVEIFGPESSGKTTLCLHAIAEAQRAGLLCAFVDAEHAIDVGYAQKLGVDVERLLISQPSYGEEALDITETLIKSGEVGLIVVDSVAALVPKSELEGDMGDQQVGVQARMMNKGMRKLTGQLNQQGATVMFINQIRNKIGVMFGSNETTPGGNALKFFASVRLDIRRIQTLKNSDGPYGSRTRVKVVKNKVAPPFQIAEFDVVFGRGIDREGELIDLGLAEGRVTKSGSWFSLGERRLGQGREAACTALREDAALRAELEAGLAAAAAPAEDVAAREEAA